MTRRQTIVTYLVVVPFAVVLGFPFFFALVTMFKTNLDLANVDHSPYTYNDLAGHLHWDFWNYATLDHVRFLFEETNYPTWLLNTAIVGGAVVVITLLLAMPAGYALARLAGGWGQGAGVGIFLVYLIRRSRQSPNIGLRLAFAMILGGAVGNLIDRVFYGVFYGYAALFYGKVVDFELKDISGSTEHHMHHSVFTLIDANHHTEDWTFMMKDKPMHAHFDLHRTN